MKLLCIDIGNTHTHFCVFSDPDMRDLSSASDPGTITTKGLTERGSPLYRELEACAKQPEEWSGIALCSVVPEATSRFRVLLAQLGISLLVFQLRPATLNKIRLHYPHPEEIGQDRLANVVAATSLYPLPCVVIDLGTAVTFDVISSRRGYEGGIIAPGIAIMTHYLHEKTALLPQLESDLIVTGAIGKSTFEAMTIGCLVGFRGMIEALLTTVKEDLEKQGETNLTVLVTGGTGKFLFSRTNPEEAGPEGRIAGIVPIYIPDLTLKGLAIAFQQHNAPSAK